MELTSSLRKWLVYLLIASAGMLSCQRDEVYPGFDDLPVIQAFLKADDIFSLNISRQIPYDPVNAVFSEDSIDELEIIISINDQEYSLFPFGNGNYRNDSLIVRAGDRYDIRFMFNNKLVTASTIIPSKPQGFKQNVTQLIIPAGNIIGPGGFGSQPDPVKLSWDNPDASWFVVVVENTETDPQPIRSNGGLVQRFFRGEPARSSSYELRSTMFHYYGNHRIILFHLTPDYAVLYEKSNTTSQNLTAPSTGVTNGVGIFTGVNSDTLWVRIVE
jgi:hypothetical protein